MKRVKRTYSRKETTTTIRVRRNTRPAAQREPLKLPEVFSFRLPGWLPVAASVTLVLMIIATVNFKAYSGLSREEQQYQELNQKVQQMTEENLGIQEEIYYLKNDSATIEREAKKYGLVRTDKQVSRAGELDEAEESNSRQTPTR